MARTVHGKCLVRCLTQQALSDARLPLCYLNTPESCVCNQPPLATKKRLPLVSSVLTCEAAIWCCLCSFKAASDVYFIRMVQSQMAQLDLPPEVTRRQGSIALQD